MHLINFRGMKAIVGPALVLASETGHAALQKYPEADFSATWWDRPESENKVDRKVSLRSRDDGVDVSKIAGMFGGGGHEHASGFNVKVFIGYGIHG
jgi:nanoRNase/pAp phosphatase (c-di-AMP/oligoRNAs hydrolase)